MQISHKYKFKNGKYTNQSYLQVWDKDPDYFYWMESQFGSYWTDIVRQLEKRDNEKEKQKTVQVQIQVKFPSVDQVKQIFLSNPICGFDMSDYICDLYESYPDDKKNNYFQSLLLRNNIHLK